MFLTINHKIVIKLCSELAFRFKLLSHLPGCEPRDQNSVQIAVFYHSTYKLDELV